MTSEITGLRVGKSPLGDLGVKTNNNKLPKYNNKFVPCGIQIICPLFFLNLFV